MTASARDLALAGVVLAFSTVASLTTGNALWCLPGYTALAWALWRDRNTGEAS